MKEKELRESATCGVCNKLIGEAVLPIFTILNFERYVLDMRAIQRQDGLANFFGSSVLANVMGADKDMAKLISSKKVTICEDCIIKKVRIFDLIEEEIGNTGE